MNWHKIHHLLLLNSIILKKLLTFIIPTTWIFTIKNREIQSWKLFLELIHTSLLSMGLLGRSSTFRQLSKFCKFSNQLLILKVHFHYQPSQFCDGSNLFVRIFLQLSNDLFHPFDFLCSSPIRHLHLVCKWRLPLWYQMEWPRKRTQKKIILIYEENFY